MGSCTHAARARACGGGFTLIELLIVVAVIAILALIALPSYQGQRVRAQIVEGAHLADFAKARIASQWLATAGLPADNAAAGLPPADRIVGTFVGSITVDAGALHIVFANSADSAIRGRTLTLRPAIVADAPAVPLSWVCGHASAPQKMTAQGSDRTDIAPGFLPINCR
jgi:type IV pilus assembly protein PilA